MDFVARAIVQLARSRSASLLRCFHLVGDSPQLEQVSAHSRRPLRIISPTEWSAAVSQLPRGHAAALLKDELQHMHFGGIGGGTAPPPIPVTRTREALNAIGVAWPKISTEMMSHCMSWVDRTQSAL